MGGGLGAARHAYPPHSLGLPLFLLFFGRSKGKSGALRFEKRTETLEYMKITTCCTILKWGQIFEAAGSVPKLSRFQPDNFDLNVTLAKVGPDAQN